MVVPRGNGAHGAVEAEIATVGVVEDGGQDLGPIEVRVEGRALGAESSGDFDRVEPSVPRVVGLPAYLVEARAVGCFGVEVGGRGCGVDVRQADAYADGALPVRRVEGGPAADAADLTRRAPTG